MSKFDLHIKIFDEKVIESLKVKPNLSFWVREIFSDLLSGRLNYSEKNIKAEIEIQKLRRLKLDNRMKEIELQYMENFGNRPTLQGKTAIKTNVYTDSTSVKNAIDEIIYEKDPEKKGENNWRDLTNEETNAFADVMYLSDKTDDGFNVKCHQKNCGFDIWFEFRQQAIFEANRHLLAVHGKGFMKEDYESRKENK